MNDTPDKSPRIMQKSESFLDWMTWLGSLLAMLVLLYFLTAPPVMIAAWKQNNGSHLPAIYNPIIHIIESDFGGPLVWYFNTVWHAGIILIGDMDGPPWYLVLLYATIGIGLIVGALFPFIRRMRKSRHDATK